MTDGTDKVLIFQLLQSLDAKRNEVNRYAESKHLEGGLNMFSFNIIDHKTALELTKLIDTSNIQLKRKLGSGGFGEVYEAIYKGSVVAVKIISSALSSSTIKILSEVAIQR